MTQLSGIPTLASLEATHEFPCHYTLKAIGANTDAFEAEATRIAGEVSGYPESLRVSRRLSGKGNHRAITLEVYVQSAHQVQALYTALFQVDGLKMML